MRKIYYLFLLTILFSCSKSSDPIINANEDIDIFTFGETEGDPLLSSSQLWPHLEFDLKEGKLLEVTYPQGVRTEKLLDDNKAKQANLLRNSPIPDYLWESVDIRTFGCTGCTQTNMVYLRVTKRDDNYSWYFNKNIDRIPSQIKGYVRKLIEILDSVKR